MWTRVRTAALVAALMAGTAGLAFAQSSNGNDEMRHGMSNRHHGQAMRGDRDRDRNKSGSSSTLGTGGSTAGGGTTGSTVGTGGSSAGGSKD